jgi:DNA mismatch endonuclease (patch repair protein)
VNGPSSVIISTLKTYPENNIVVPQFNEANGFYTTRQRSELMSKIRSKNTKPEVKVRKTLWALGFRYRKNVKKLPGSPDIVFTKQKLVVFIDGEFWHGFDWDEKKSKIKSNRGFWIPKIERNMQRDFQNEKHLTDRGWHVMRFWERQVKRDFDSCIRRIVSYLQVNGQ